MIDPRTFYRLLLKLYPARFREEYQSPLERQFWDDYRDSRGFGAKTRFWMQALADLAVSIPVELLRELRQDLRFAARIYRQRPMVTALALVALAVAIGATTGVFSVVDTLLLGSLPFRAPERLVQLFLPPVAAGLDGAALRDWVRRSPYLESAAGYQTTDVNLVQSERAVRVTLAETTAPFFQVLGVEPEIGRPFADDEDTPGKDGVVILSHALWDQVFGGNPSVLGASIRLNGVPMTVIGVAPAGMDFPAHAALWTPTAFDLTRNFKEHAIFTHHVGRLKAGIPLARAAAMFETETRRADPESFREEERNRPRLTSLRDQLTGSVRQASLVLMGVAGFVLLIACANVAHLLLSRITERRRELEIRAALGASRARLVQQLTTESMLLTVTAASAGMLVAHWASRLAAAFQPTPLESQKYTILDWRVVGFAVALAALTGLLFGVLPARLIGRMTPAAGLAHTQGGDRGSGVRRLRGFMVAMQAAFTLVLLAGALTMGRSFLKLTGSDLGFRTGQVVTMNVALAGTPHQGARRTYYREALDRLRGIPGVESAGAADILPLTPNLGFLGAGFQPDGAHKRKMGVVLAATPGYFATMRTEILEGRDFTADDRQAAIVTDAFARQYPELRLVGHTLQGQFFEKPLTIVGIVRGQVFSPGSSQGPTVYVPAALWLPDNLTFVARVRGKTEAYVAICRDALQSVDPKAPVYNAKTLDERFRERLAGPRFYTTVILFAGSFALLLAVIGMYGVASFLVVQRTHEIGVRLAVGASHERLRAMLLRQSLAPVFAGMVVGVAGTMALGSLVQNLIVVAEPIGGLRSMVAAALLLGTATVAIWTATKRVLRLDPIRVLRAD